MTLILITLILIIQGLIMTKLDSVSSQVDSLIVAFDVETNAIAARIDAFEIAVGSTVTQQQIDSLKSLSARLKSLGADAALPVPAVPAAEAATRAQVAALSGAPAVVEVVVDEPAPKKSFAPKA